MARQSQRCSGHQANKQFHSPFQLSSDPSNCFWAGLKLVILIVVESCCWLANGLNKTNLAQKYSICFGFVRPFKASFLLHSVVPVLCRVYSNTSQWLPHQIGFDWRYSVLLIQCSPPLPSSGTQSTSLLCCFHPFLFFLSIYRCWRVGSHSCVSSSFWDMPWCTTDQSFSGWIPSHLSTTVFLQAPGPLFLVRLTFPHLLSSPLQPAMLLLVLVLSLHSVGHAQEFSVALSSWF